MNVVSLFTGVGGIDLGLEQAGHRILHQCEADEWRRHILRHRFRFPPATQRLKPIGVEFLGVDWYRSLLMPIRDPEVTP